MWHSDCFTLIYMNLKHIDNIARYCYDISKLMLGILVVDNIVSDKFNYMAFWIGLAATSVFFILGYLIDRISIEGGQPYG